MLELSPTNRNAGADYSIPELVGDNSNKGEEENGKKSTFYKTVEDAIEGLKANPITNSNILIKGSRGMTLERLVELF